MSDAASKRAIAYFEPELHTAIRLKAAHTYRSMSEIVNDAVRLALREDQEDLAAFEDRVAEPSRQTFLLELRQSSWQITHWQNTPIINQRQ